MPYCSICGTEVSEDAQFCPKCGSSLRVGRRYERRHEKYEKEEEKTEKREKEEKGEKDEKGQNRTSPVTGGLVLIWLGITIYLATIRAVSWGDWWAYFLLGLGVILIIQAVILFLSIGRGELAYGPLIGGGVLIVAGVIWVFGISYWWPLIPIAVGIAIIVTALRERRRNPKP